MRNHWDDSEERAALRQKIIGLGENSMRKSYYPELQARLAELERSNQDLEDFAYIASHDLQEPMRKVQAFAAMLKYNYGQALGEGNDILDRMQQSANRMQTMIQDLLSYSRVATQAHPFQPVDLNEIVGDIVLDLDHQIKRSKGQVDVCPLPVIEADALQMHQLFLNLITNALKFHRKDIPPQVRVFVREEKSDQVTICVQDEGIGFDMQHRELIFKPFQRLHRRNEFAGSGIGLAICQKIVLRHQGKIQVESTPGTGTLFAIMLPLRQGE